MPFKHGSKAKFWLGTKATPTVLVDLSSYCNDVQLPASVDSAETSTFGNKVKTFVPGLIGYTLPLSGRWHPTVDTQLHDLLGEESVDMKWQPQGAATGLIYYTFTGFITAYTPATSITEVGSWTSSFQINTDPVRGTN